MNLKKLNMKIFNYFKNCWKFRNELIEFKPWDYTFNLRLLRKSIIETKCYIEDEGNEVYESRIQKINSMNRCIHLIDCITNSDFIKSAEEKLNLKLSNLQEKFNKDIENNSLIIEESRLIEENCWNELFNLLNDTMECPHGGTKLINVSK